MSDNPRYQRDKVTGRFAKIGNSIEDITNISADDTMPGMEIARHAPEADGNGRWPVHTLIEPRRAVLVHPDDQGRHGRGLRTAARSSGPGDPTPYLVGLDHGLAPEQPGEVIARQQTPSQATAYGDGGRTMSPRRAEDIEPYSPRRR